MRPDGCLTDEELPCDLAVVETSGHQHEHLALALGESADEGRVDAGLRPDLGLDQATGAGVSMQVEALSLGAVAVSGLLFGRIPRWLAASAGAIAVALGVGYTISTSFQTAPTLAWFLWMAVASVTLFVQAPRNESSVQPAHRAVAAGAV